LFSYFFAKIISLSFSSDGTIDLLNYNFSPKPSSLSLSDDYSFFYEFLDSFFTMSKPNKLYSFSPSPKLPPKAIGPSAPNNTSLNALDLLGIGPNPSSFSSSLSSLNAYYLALNSSACTD
jgi:hypothetical protein